MVLAGCAGAPKPTRLIVDTHTSATVNPDAGGRATPVVVRVYGLKTLDPFQSADFFSLYEDDRGLLGASMLYREERLMNPGEQWRLEAKLPPETRYLGVVAAFREIDRAQWRSVVPLRPGKKNRLRIHLEDHRVEIDR